MYYDIVKYYYDLGIYTTEEIKVFVKKKKITEDEYKDITGEDYAA